MSQNQESRNGAILNQVLIIEDDNLPACAQELLDWHRTGLLPENGVINAVAALMGEDKDCRDAERLIINQCLKFVASGAK